MENTHCIPGASSPAEVLAQWDYHSSIMGHEAIEGGSNACGKLIFCIPSNGVKAHRLVPATMTNVLPGNVVTQLRFSKFSMAFVKSRSAGSNGPKGKHEMPHGKEGVLRTSS